MTIKKTGYITRTYRHLERLLEILGVAVKFGFDDLIDRLKIEQYLHLGRKIFSRKDLADIEGLSRPKRLRLALEELGPTFVKMGQMLSTRADLLPPDFVIELVRLQDEVAPFPFEQIKEIIETELNTPLDMTFRNVDAEPMAAASIGQVHRAGLRDGTAVVIKVQRPGIKSTIDADLEIMLYLAGLMEKHLEGWDVHRPTKLVEEFARNLNNELDYTNEAANLERLASLFADDPRAYIPKVFPKATTPRVLTMEYIDGINSGSLDRLKAEGYDLKEIADRGAELMMKQIFVYGFFHADPHPANLMILPNHVICFLDLGMMGRLDRITREQIVDLVMAVARRDESAMVGTLLALTRYEEEPDRRELERAVSDLVNRHLYKPLHEIQLGKLLHQLFDLAARFRLRLSPDILLLVKAVTTLEGLGQRLDPGFDVIKTASPFVREIQKDRFRPRRLARDLIGYSNELFHLLKEVPGDLKAVLRLAKQGKLKIEFEHIGLTPLLNTQDRTSNRLAFAIVIASLVIGSSLIIHSGIPPKWHDIPLIGLAGYVVAGIMGFWLLISILRRGRM